MTLEDVMKAADEYAEAHTFAAFAGMGTKHEEAKADEDARVARAKLGLLVTRAISRRPAHRALCDDCEHPSLCADFPDQHRRCRADVSGVAVPGHQTVSPSGIDGGNHG